MHKISLLEKSQFIVLRLAALVTVETQRLILVRKASEHPQVHELIIANMDLQSMKISECHGVTGAFSRRDGVDRCVLRMEKQRGSKKNHHLRRCGLVLNQTGSHDFVELPPNPSMLLNPSYA